MAKKSKKELMKVLEAAKITPNNRRNIYEALTEIMDELRTLDGRALVNKISKVISKVEPLRKTVKASYKAMNKIDPISGFKAKNKFTNSKELNELMKESLKRRAWSKMDKIEINSLLKKYDDKLDFPIEIGKPPTKIFKDKDNNIFHQVDIENSLGARQGGEKQFLESASPYGVQTVKGMERAHSVGPGLGIDSPFGLFFAPRAVNQALQNQGIEAFVGILHETLKKQGKKVRLTTRAQPHFGTNRLKEIAYKIEVIDEKGKAHDLLQYGISIGNDKGPSIASGLLSKNSSLLNGLKLKEGMALLDTKNTVWKNSALKFMGSFLSSK
jgi:hypothetical protein